VTSDFFYITPEDWLFDSQSTYDVAKQGASGDFSENKHRNLLPMFVNGMLDGILSNSNFAIMSYFRQFLQKRLITDWYNVQASIDGFSNMLDVVTSVQNFIKSKVKTSLVLAGAADPRTDIIGEFSHYSPKNQININRVDIDSILSPLNLKKEVTHAVQTTHVLSQDMTYEAALQIARGFHYNRPIANMGTNGNFFQLFYPPDNTEANDPGLYALMCQGWNDDDTSSASAWKSPLTVPIQGNEDGIIYGDSNIGPLFSLEWNSILSFMFNNPIHDDDYARLNFAYSTAAVDENVLKAFIRT